jgi:hypothetical protein
MKREHVILSIIIGVLAVAVVGWVYSKSQMEGMLTGTRYIERTGVVAVFAPHDAQWTVETDAEGRTTRRWADPETNRTVLSPLQAEHADPELVADAIVRTPQREWSRVRSAPRARADEPFVIRSMPRTLGVWLAALLTLFILSFLYRDNPFYKAAESFVVGASAAYYMVVGFWTMLVPNLFGRLAPEVVRTYLLPEHEHDFQARFFIPLILGAMLLWRLAPQGAWIARWPLAFIIGITAGLRLIGFLQADFALQIQASIVPLVVYEANAFNFWMSVRNTTILLGVLACLTYFFFSIEHKGFVGRTARVGIWVLMITFGAGFAYTVMGRITLLTRRVEFLFHDWLWIGVGGG